MSIDRLRNRLNLSKDKWLRILLNLKRCWLIKKQRIKKKLCKKRAKKMKRTLNQKVPKSKMMLMVLVKNPLKNLKNKVKDLIFQNKKHI